MNPIDILTIVKERLSELGFAFRPNEQQKPYLTPTLQHYPAHPKSPVVIEISTKYFKQLYDPMSLLTILSDIQQDSCYPKIKLSIVELISPAEIKTQGSYETIPMEIADKDILIPNTSWKSSKNGNIYRIVGVGEFANIGNDDLLWTRFVRHGAFKNSNPEEKTNTSLELWEYGDLLIYGSYRNLNYLVFYYGDSGRWFRSTKEFLGKNLNSGQQRFTQV